jgi:hypothetical protein
MVHHFPMIARAQDGDRLFVASTGLRYLARNWKFESISLQRGVCKPSAPLGTIPIAGGEENAAVQLPAAARSPPTPSASSSIALAYNLGNFMRTLAMPKATKCAPSTASSIDAAMLEFGETHQSRSDFPLPGRAGLGYSAAAATASGTRFGAGVSRTPTAETIAASTAKPASA